jgi:uncharacterized protein YkwD
MAGLASYERAFSPDLPYVDRSYLLNEPKPNNQKAKPKAKAVPATVSTVTATETVQTVRPKPKSKVGPSPATTVRTTAATETVDPRGWEAQLNLRARGKISERERGRAEGVMSQRTGQQSVARARAGGRAGG